MKIVLPVTTPQVISVIPRREVFSGIQMVVTKDGEGVSETLVGLTATSNGNFIDVTFTSTILKEGHSYFFELSESGSLIYRDKLYVTSQTDFTIKHKQPQNNYTEYNVVDDNTYIV